MEDKAQHDVPNSPKHGTEKSEPVRSRWTPKPEQILILESIFNSGMVNPPKDETVRIRKLLEKFGTVGDANVFYWFQNRRSRSRRRQRQMQQATLDQQGNNNHQMMMVQVNNGGGAVPPPQAIINSPLVTTTMGFGSSSSLIINDSCGSSSSSNSSCAVFSTEGLDGLFSSLSSEMGFQGIDQTLAAASSILCSPVAPNLSYQSGVGYGGAIGSSITGFITVFINGIATEVQAVPIDMKTVFGEDVMLVHSSGVPVPTNEYGFLIQSLQHGESYFLVSKSPQV